MPKENYEELKQEKIENYRKIAERKKQESKDLWKQASEMQSVIPFGQPILVGHYSEKSDRAYRNRIHNKRQKSIDVGNEAAHYAHKANAMESNHAISQDDPEAINKLKAKLAYIENQIEEIKEFNKKHQKQVFLVAADWNAGYIEIYNKVNHRTYARIKNNELIWKIQRLDKNIKAKIEKYFKDRLPFEQEEIPKDQMPFDPYVLQNLNQNKQSVKQRIEFLEAQNAVQEIQEENNGISFKVDKAINRVMIFFPGKPSEEIRSKMKHRGFRWSPRNKAWQSYIKQYNIDLASEIVKAGKM